MDILSGCSVRANISCKFLSKSSATSFQIEVFMRKTLCLTGKKPMAKRQSRQTFGSLPY